MYGVYGSEIWTLNKKYENVFEALKTMCWRKIENTKWIEKKIDKNRWI